MALVIWTFARELGRIFSNDPEVLDKYAELALPLAAMLLSFSMACFLERIPMVMGRTKLVMHLGLVGSWMGQVPGVLVATRYWRNDAYGLYVGVAAGYLLLDILLLLVICRSDWKRYAAEARQRSEVEH